ncbi:uncharacterized protein LOC119958579 isoform X2 [Scyliorhinus canicula]|uniref:uncharacterized protein LOC119958579 isoform X2 n=1 Tax=Scyliorhinus canicula TaxID=7830 RepID=UPI0018F2DAFC|nr:uncharacterized protein LOC119958579 isoform X2 [Scyliorhinus canicula]
MINLALLWGIINLHVVVVKEIDADISVPTLSVTPEFKVFLTGEDIHLTCRCQCPIWRIHSCRNRKLIRNLYRDVNEGECENTIEFVAAPILEGNYTCQCLILEFAKWRFSNQSDPIPIQIRGHNRTTVLVHTVFSLLLFLIMVIILIDHFCECQPAGRD